MDKITKSMDAYFNSPSVQKDGAYTYEHEVKDIPLSSTNDHQEANRIIQMAEDNVDNIDTLAEEIRKLCNSVWESNWGEFREAFAKVEDIENTPGNVITYDLMARVVAEGTSPKPKHMYSVKEVVNGEYTGDTFEISLMQFDTVIEFNIWGKDSLQAKNLSLRFENLMNSFIWYFKKIGVSEIVFLKEQPGALSDKYYDDKPMRSLMYNIRLNKYYVVRGSLLRSIRVSAGISDKI